jgi:hypothetical protein
MIVLYVEISHNNKDSNRSNYTNNHSKGAIYSAIKAAVRKFTLKQIIRLRAVNGFP